MAVFKVVINGNIAGIGHRFSGNNGIPERYETESSKEIIILRDCLYASEVTEDKLEEESEADGADPGMPSPTPEGAEEATLREKLEAIPSKELRSDLKGQGIIKVGMNDVALVQAVLDQPEMASAILRGELSNYLEQ